MSQASTMDPDIPAPSIEHDESPIPVEIKNFTSFRDTPGSPLATSSPDRTPFKTPLSHPATPAPSKSPRSPSLIKNERRSSPNLKSQRSSSSLSVSRGTTPSRTLLRRVSSNLNPASPTVNMRPPESIPPQPMTAEHVAKEYFQQELEAHTEAQSKTVVIVNDSCYGHRFSRPRTTKAALSTIVERPERIHATLLGASTAYVRLGGRHADGANGPHPGRDTKTVLSPPFLLNKTARSIALNHPAVTHVHGAKWMEELQIMCDSAESKLALNGKELQRPIGYGKDEDGSNLPKLHEGDLYLCSESLAALQGCLGGVCDAVDTVFSPSATKRAFVCIRPPGHHCSSNYPSGFCWLNNVHVGISYAAMNQGLTHAAIIDFDLHHGDGSQTITWDHNRDAQSLPKNSAQHKKIPIGYYSLHDINSYPCEWGDEEKVRNASLCIENAHGQSIWNVHLEPWTSLEHFWQLYETKYSVLLEKTRVFLRHHSDRLRSAGVQPKAVIFLSAGFDASQWEGQGMQRHNVNVPTEFYARFTSDIVNLAAESDLGVDGRVISVLEGGYSDRALISGVLSHLCGLSGEPSSDILNPTSMKQISNGLGVDPNIETSVAFSYDSEWWHPSNLEALEYRVLGKMPPLPKKKEKVPGNFSSPTHASTARMTDVARERKSLSAQVEARFSPDSYDPGPPPPVDWIVASYELSRILIPSDRQTLSCRHDELNAEATKARRERQSAIGLPASEPRMQLRTRGKGPTAEPEAIRAASRTSNRRTTIAAMSELPDPSMPSQRPRRRSSAGSSILSSFQDMKLDDMSSAAAGQHEFVQPKSAVPEPAKEIVAKKSKMAPPAKKTTSRISSPRKAKDPLQPVARVAAFQDKLSGTKAQSIEQAPESALQSRQSSSANSTNIDGVDDLTSGMKKVSIKLKMPTPEQHAENLKKTEEAKVKKPRATRKPPVPKVVRSKAALALTPIGAQTQVTPAVSSVPESDVTSPKQALSIDGSTHNPKTSDSMLIDTPPHSDADYQAGLGITSALTAPPSGDVISNIASSQDNRISPYDGTELQSSPAAPKTVLPPQEIKRMDTDTVPKRTKADLPVFTSSSPIPFASGRLPAKQEETEAKQDPSIWDVPDTPRR